MKSKRIHVAVHIAALVFCSALCILLGCGKNDKPAPAPSGVWSEDPAFKKELKEHHDHAVELGKRRSAVQKRMDEMTAIMREKLATKDDKKVVEELEKNAEWRSLKEKAAVLDAEFEKRRKEMLSHVRRHMNQEDISK